MSKRNTVKKIRRKFGFNKDREGIITRYIQEEQNWQSHIDRTKSFILDTAETKKKDLCIVLGSGWLLDIPILELSEMFNEVQLFDISHPAQILHKYRTYDNIKFVDSDITGALSLILKRNYHSKHLSEISKIIDSMPYDTKADYVISANILSQLSFFPDDYLKKKDFDDDEEIKEFIKTIEQNHIDNLPKNNSCLISDYYQYIYDNNDNLLFEENRLLIELPKKIHKEWIWDFDLSGNYKPNKKVRFKVAALQV